MTYRTSGTYGISQYTYTLSRYFFKLKYLVLNHPAASVSFHLCISHVKLTLRLETFYNKSFPATKESANTAPEKVNAILLFLA